MKTRQCAGLFDHSMDKLKTVETTKEYFLKRCVKCGFEEKYARSRKTVPFVSGNLIQKKKWGADDNRKELLQPMNDDGEVNDEFTEAYGFNPFDDRTKSVTPKVQGGLA